MQFFIDTANLDQIKEAQALGILDGVTTNPSLMAKEGIAGEENVMKHYKAICDIVEDKVSAEVIATDYEGMIAEGENKKMQSQLLKIDENDQFGLLLATAQADTIGNITVKEIKI